MLRIMEADPRLPRLPRARRDERRDHARRRGGDPRPPALRQGSRAQRSPAGRAGRRPRSRRRGADGARVASEALAGKPHVLYFWFSGCPPCARTSPLLPELQRAPRRRGASRSVALNADAVLEVPAERGRARRLRARGTAGRFARAEATPGGARGLRLGERLPHLLLRRPSRAWSCASSSTSRTLAALDAAARPGARVAVGRPASRLRRAAARAEVAIIKHAPPARRSGAAARAGWPTSRRRCRRAPPRRSASDSAQRRGV